MIFDFLTTNTAERRSLTQRPLQPRGPWSCMVIHLQATAGHYVILPLKPSNRQGELGDFPPQPGDSIALYRPSGSVSCSVC